MARKITIDTCIKRLPEYLPFSCNIKVLAPGTIGVTTHKTMILGVEMAILMSFGAKYNLIYYVSVVNGTLFFIISDFEDDGKNN